jgi:hypothetical protein
VTSRFARSLAVLGLATGAVALSPGVGNAVPTEHVTITVTVDASDPHYGAKVEVRSLDNANETFDINVVRIDNVLVRTAGCTDTNVCHISGDAGVGAVVDPAVFEVHAIGGQRTLFDNAFDVFTETTVCTAPTSCVGLPVVLASPV